MPAVSAELDAEHTELSLLPRHQLQVVVLTAGVIRGVITSHQTILPEPIHHSLQVEKKDKLVNIAPVLVRAPLPLTYGHKVEAVRPAAVNQLSPIQGHSHVQHRPAHVSGLKHESRRCRSDAPPMNSVTGLVYHSPPMLWTDLTSIVCSSLKPCPLVS